MMKMQKPFVRGINWGMTKLISILGFGYNTYENATEEYGVPHTEFSTKNNVRETTQEPEMDKLYIESVI